MLKIFYLDRVTNEEALHGEESGTTTSEDHRKTPTEVSWTLQLERKARKLVPRQGQWKTSSG